MSSSLLESEVEKALRGAGQAQGVHVVPSVSARKMLGSLQVCVRCRRRFAFRPGRKNCPFCSGLLVVKVMVLKES